MQENISIIGAGLVGSLLSVFLAKRRYPVSIYERRPDMRRESVSAGRSINLALSDRGIRALQRAGVFEDILPLCIPMHGRYIHKQDGSTAYQPYGNEGQYINSVSRGALNAKLMDVAEAHGVNIHFQHKFSSIDWNTNELVLENSLSKKVVINPSIIFGSDGAFSAARSSFQSAFAALAGRGRARPGPQPKYSESYLDFGYKELTIPPGASGQHQMEKNALHIWPRGNYMLIALPNIDGSFTCTLFFPFEGTPSFKSLDTKEKVMDFFAENFTDATALMPTLEIDFQTNPTSSLVTIKSFPWVYEDRFALIGDAAHAIVPFFGQGMNCGFEDCSVLDDLIDKNTGNWKQIFSRYEELRKPDADAIADLALNNFVEMRDRVGDERFLLQKKIEAHFSSLHPDKWIPAYSQVTFSPHIRYSEALESSQKQEAIMNQIMKLEDIEQNWNSPSTEHAILYLLNLTPNT